MDRQKLTRGGGTESMKNVTYPIMDCLPDPAILVDISGRVEFANGKAAALFGYPAEQMQGMELATLADGSEQELATGLDMLHASRPAGSHVSSWIKGSGETFTARVWSGSFGNQKAVRFLISFQKIVSHSPKDGIPMLPEATLSQSGSVEHILESISECFCTVDSQWRIRYWNKAAESTTGKYRLDILGRNIWEVFPQEKESALFDGCMQVMAGRKSLAFENRSATGTCYYNSAHPNEDGGMTIYFKDITSSHLQVNETLEVKNNLNALINATDDLMWSVDTEYGLIFTNKAFSRFLLETLGYELKAGECIFSKASRSLQEEWKILYDRCLAGEAFQFRLERLPDMITRFNPIFSTAGQITGVACHSVDTSELTRLEKEKGNSAERLRAVVQNASDLIIIFGSDYSLNYMTPSASCLLGRDAEKSTLNFFRLIHPEDARALQQRFKSGIGSKPVILDDFRIKSSDGRWLWMEAIVDNLLENPAVSGMVITARDITAHKERTAERELLVKELLRSNTDLMQFSFITSHNLRSPLSNIMGLLRLLEDEEAGAPAASQIVQMIGSATRKLSETVNDLSEILIIRNNKEIPTEILDLEQTFHKVNRNFIEAENDLDASVFLNLSEIEVCFNREYLESIFVNLISNSIKYRHHERRLRIEITSQITDGGISMRYRDNGLGMDTARHGERIFGMYQRFHPNTEGQGLGLFIIKEQITAMGGEIAVESVLGEYTCFNIFIPNCMPSNANLQH